ncbi:MAG: PIG-L family deacetylase [bacterium]|nr:PIG-L family deacetylase [bacterium]MDW8163487.1 PIG-L family deacetylase [Candidatus Omnitrophota bacterium]
MNILAIGAHPDDIEILCGGTLAKCSKKGHNIFMAHLCSGDKGGKDISPSELVKIRKMEAKKSASLIGAEVLGPIADDLDLYNTREMRIKVIDIIRYTKPDIIITHSPEDYMPDHIITSQLVFEAAFPATLPNYRTEYPPHELITPIFYMDTLVGLKFQPTHYVDITEFFEIKKQMLLCHESQYKWIKGHHLSDPLNIIETVAKFRGLQCGVLYAEGFRIENVWGRVKPVDLI